MSLATLPVIVVPGIQGRWEWMRPALDALRTTDGSKTPRLVLTFSLNEEDGTADPFEQWMTLLEREAARSGSDRVVLIGVSFGGLVALRYAARFPHRVAALILVSAPSPGYRLSEFDQAMVHRPLALLPKFAVRGLRRLTPEIVAAKDTWAARLSFMATYGFRVVTKPASPTQMARWVRAWQETDLAADCERIVAPTHLITGEPRLDRVVPVQSTLHYLTLIPGSTFSRLTRTGHIGLVSRPSEFSSIVNEFLHAADTPGSRRSA